MWIHEHPDWPAFIWNNQAIEAALTQATFNHGILLGKIGVIPEALQQEAHIASLTRSITDSWAIEGYRLSMEDVRSSIERNLGFAGLAQKRGNDYVDRIVEINLAATKYPSLPLTKEILCNWHTSIIALPKHTELAQTVGDWRTEQDGTMRVVSGYYGKEKVHYQAPSHERVPKEMQRFITWFNQYQDHQVEQHAPEGSNADPISKSTPSNESPAGELTPISSPIIAAAIAHYWFVAIHPFSDGNGRIARALTDNIFAHAEKSPVRFYSLSQQIMKERADYYQALDVLSKSTTMDITSWLLWFIGCFNRALATSESSLNHIWYRHTFWNKAAEFPLTKRQKLVLDRMLQDDWVGHIQTRKYSKIARCSPDTALRDITKLVTYGLLQANPGGGRSTSYRLWSNKN